MNVFYLKEFIEKQREEENKKRAQKPVKKTPKSEPNRKPDTILPKTDPNQNPVRKPPKSYSNQNQNKDQNQKENDQKQKEDEELNKIFVSFSTAQGTHMKGDTFRNEFYKHFIPSYFILSLPTDLNPNYRPKMKQNSSNNFEFIPISLPSFYPKIDFTQFNNDENRMKYIFEKLCNIPYPSPNNLVNFKGIDLELSISSATKLLIANPDNIDIDKTTICLSFQEGSLGSKVVYSFEFAFVGMPNNSVYSKEECNRYIITWLACKRRYDLLFYEVQFNDQYKGIIKIFYDRYPFLIMENSIQFLTPPLFKKLTIQKGYYYPKNNSNKGSG